MMWFMNGLGRTGIQDEQTGYHSSYMDANSYLNAIVFLALPFKLSRFKK